MSLCPITMKGHRDCGPTCERCDDAVRRHLAWFRALEPDARERFVMGAWYANDALHWAAVELAEGTYDWEPNDA